MWRARSLRSKAAVSRKSPSRSRPHRRSLPQAEPPPSAPAARSARPRLPPLAPLDRKVKTALRRGARSVNAAINLHGLRQEQAHGALLAFLRRSQAVGHTVVLVVTGKGASGPDGDGFEERGILRRVVPHWLAPARRAPARPRLRGGCAAARRRRRALRPLAPPSARRARRLTGAGPDAKARRFVCIPR